MSKHIHSDLPSNKMREADENLANEIEDAANEATDRVSFSFKEVSDTTMQAAKRASDSAKDMYHSAALKAEEALVTSKAYVRRNPLPVVLGTIAVGAAIGYLMVRALRKPTFRERYADEPFDAVRDMILSALSPVTRSVHKGYDSAREGAEKALDKAHHFNSKRAVHSISHRVGRLGENLKFW